MSRTDKTRPYNVQRNDRTLPGYEVHDHASGECDFESLEQWQRRYNDPKHSVKGARVRFYDCYRRLRRDVRNSCFGDDPDRKGAREVFKRHDRQRARVGCQQARWLDDDFGEQVSDDLTAPQPHKRYYPEDQSYRRGTSKMARANIRAARKRPDTVSRFELWYQERQRQLELQRSLRFIDLYFKEPWNLNWSEWPDKVMKSQHHYLSKVVSW